MSKEIDKNIQTGDVERRIYDFSTAELRQDTNNSNVSVIEGYAAVFDTFSRDLGGFKEIIRRGAFDNVLNDDVRALFNHDANFVLGRTTSGTLTLKVDDTGL